MSNFHEYLQPGEDPDELQDIMESEGVTLPVARNMAKMRRLGLGSRSTPKPRQPPSIRQSRVPAERPYSPERPAVEKKGSKATMADLFEGSGPQKPAPAKKIQSRSLGIESVGMVQSRPQEVDPFAQPLPRQKPDKEEEEVELEDPNERIARMQKLQEDLQAAREKMKQLKRKRGLHTASQERDDSDRSESPARHFKEYPDPVSQPSGSSGSSGKMMSEAEVVAMMSSRKHTERGSERTQKRIQKEQRAWEAAKRSNPEYWKAPKFCQVLGKANLPMTR